MPNKGWYVVTADKDYHGGRVIVAITQDPKGAGRRAELEYDAWIGKGDVTAHGPFDNAADAAACGKELLAVAKEVSKRRMKRNPHRQTPVSSRMMNRSGKFKKPFHLTKWEERDRVHIALVDDDSQTIVEWWDDEAREAFEDGFLDRRRLQASAEEYAKHMGII